MAWMWHDKAVIPRIVASGVDYRAAARHPLAVSLAGTGYAPHVAATGLRMKSADDPDYRRTKLNKQSATDSGFVALPLMLNQRHGLAHFVCGLRITTR
jgi:hypothetical protein